MELNRAATVLAALDTDGAGAAAAVWGALVGAVAAEPAATVVAEGVGAVTDLAVAAGLETLAATGAGVALGLATLAVDA